MDWSSVRCSKCRAEFSVECADATIIGPHDTLPYVSCERCGGDAIPKAYLPDLVVSREKRIVIEISGAKSSIHDRSKVDFYYKHGIRWIEVTKCNSEVSHGGQGHLPGACTIRQILSSRKNLESRRVVLIVQGL